MAILANTRGDLAAVYLAGETKTHYSILCAGEVGNPERKVSKDSKNEKLFCGDDAVDDAIKWIETLRQ